MDDVICCVIDNNTIPTQATVVRRTKIIATIGPACSSEDMLRNMIRSGMNCARLNFSHGTKEEHQRMYNKIRTISQEEDTPVAILQDLQGPKIRTTELAEPLQLQKDQLVIISTDPAVIGTKEKIGTTYMALAFDAKPGHVLLLDDGLLQMTVLSQRLLDKQQASIGDELVCRVDVGGVLRSHKGINLPGTPISAPALTEKDIEDLQFGLTLGVDFLAMSFVRTGADISNAKLLMQQMAGFSIPIISKIERIEALTNIDDIIQESFGIMVARGDLGVELDMTDLPILQKQLIQKASKVGKLDITATQMLTSMMENTIPTRAEISDVANAVFDGTDAIMMSNESAVGKYPLLALQMMGKIAANADKYYQTFGRDEMFDVSEDATEISSIAAALIAKKKRNIKAIVTITIDGVLPLVLSQSKPVQPVLAITKNRNTYNAMALYYGVQSILVSTQEYDKLDASCNVPAVLRDLLVTGKKVPWLHEGDAIVYLQTLQREHVVRLAEL